VLELRVFLWQPVRITASAALGKAGLINIEARSEPQRPVHDKGVQLFPDFCAPALARSPLSLARVFGFEQSYSAWWRQRQFY